MRACVRACVRAWVGACVRTSTRTRVCAGHFNRTHHTQLSITQNDGVLVTINDKPMRACTPISIKLTWCACVHGHVTICWYIVIRYNNIALILLTIATRLSGFRRFTLWWVIYKHMRACLRACVSDPVIECTNDS